MKKTLWTTSAVLIVSAIAYAGYYAFIPGPESEQIRKQYHNHLKSRDESKFAKNNIKQTTYQSKSTEFQISLALAYNREKKPDEAIVLIEELIKQNRDPQLRLFGRLMPRGSWAYAFDAHYYEMLADSFDLKKDTDSRDKALKNKSQALAEEKRLSTIHQYTGNDNQPKSAQLIRTNTVRDRGISRQK